MSREFSALVLAGSTIDPDDPSLNGYGNGNGNGNRNNNLDRIGEDEGEAEETNPLAIVPDSHPLPSPQSGSRNGNEDRFALSLLMGSQGSSNSNNNSNNNNSSNSNNSNNNNNNNNNNNIGGEITVYRVKKEEVETKISAWQTAKIAKINNRFKREDAIIGGWENEQVHKASSWMKKVEVRNQLSIY